jgi:hypothetical protein
VVRHIFQASLCGYTLKVTSQASYDFLWHTDIGRIFCELLYKSLIYNIMVAIFFAKPDTCIYYMFFIINPFNFINHYKNH